MSKRTFSFSWNYISLLSPEPVEFDPVLHFYISSSAVGVEPRIHRIALFTKDESKRVPIASSYDDAQMDIRRLVDIQKDNLQTHRNVSSKLGFAQTSALQYAELMCTNSHRTRRSAQRAYADAIANSKTIERSIAQIASETINPNWYAPEKLTRCTFVFDEQQSFSLYQDVALNIDAFAHTYNKKGELSLAEAGSCSLYLKELIMASEKQDIVVQKQLKVYNAEGLVKGLMVMTFSNQELLKPISTSSTSLPISAELKPTFMPVSFYDYIGKNKEHYLSRFKKYILANYAVFSNNNSKPTWDFMKNIHSPMYKFRGITAPGLCFTLLYNKSAMNSTKYYENLLDITLRRHYKTARNIAEARKMFVSANDEETAVILAQMCCIFSNTCVYMTDNVHAVPSQHAREIFAADKVAFKPMRAEERASTVNEVRAMRAQIASERGLSTTLPATTRHIDVTHESIDEHVHLHFADYKKLHHDLDDEFDRIVQKMSPEDARRQRIESQSSVDQETADRINNSAYTMLIESFSVWLRETYTGDCEDMAREILRHLYDVREQDFSSSPLLQKLQRIRRQYFALQTLKGVTSAALTDDFSQIKDMGAHMDITLIYAPYLLTLMQNFNSNKPLLEKIQETFQFEPRSQALPTLVCEGTGILYPRHGEDESLGGKMYLMQGGYEVFNNVKSILYQPLCENSAFYKTIQSALVHDFISKGYGIGEVVFFKKHDFDNLKQSQTDFSTPNNNTNSNTNPLVIRKWNLNDFNRLMNDSNANEVDTRKANKHVEQRIDAQLSYEIVEPGKRRDTIVQYMHEHSTRNTKNEDDALRMTTAKNEEAVHAHLLRDVCDWDHMSDEQLKNVQNLDDFVTILREHHESTTAMENNNTKIGSALSFGSTTAHRNATYGIEHTKLINEEVADISVYAMPDVTEDELLSFHRVLCHNHPLEPIKCPSVNAMTWQSQRDVHANLLLEKICALSRSQRRLETYVRDTLHIELSDIKNATDAQWAEICKHVFHVDFFFRYDQITPQRMNALKNLFDQKDHLLHIEYFDEPVSENFGSYLVRFTCNRLRAVHM